MVMDKKELTSLVMRRLAELAHDKGETLPAIDPTTALLGGGLPIDSLDLAVIVVELEGATGNDPFRDGFVEFRTVQDLVDLFASRPA